MKRKIITLLTIAFLLTGCGRGKKISADEASTIISQIANSDEAVEALFKRKRLHMAFDSHLSDGYNQKEIDKKWTLDYSYEHQYCHYFYNYDGKINEEWTFVQGEKLYCASSDQVEKNYVEYTTQSIELNGKSFDQVVAGEAAWRPFALLGLNWYLVTFQESAKYYSSGDGNLTIIFNSEITDNGHPTEYKCKIKVRDYIIKKGLMEYTSDGLSNPMTGEYVEGKQEYKEKITTSKKVQITYPDLSEYTKRY